MISDMACLTGVDIKNLSLFVQNQKKIFRRNQLLENAPHIGSHTVTRVWRCTDEYAFRDPVELDSQSQSTYERLENVSHEQWVEANRQISALAIVAEWSFDETGCNAISCNPYYPEKGVCEGLENTDDGHREEPFAFTTAHGRRVDACQPICYDADQTKDTYVGMTSLYAKAKRSCYVINPELLAFYLDPHRRNVDETKFPTEKSALEVTLEYLEPTGTPVLIARIDEEYCRQYGLDYVEEREGTKTYGSCKVDKNEGSLTALSTWVGLTATRTYNIGRDAFIKLVRDTSARSGKTAAATSVATRGPTTLEFLSSEKTWLENVNVTKKSLPFPLKLTDLGLDVGSSDGLMWTDEYSYLADGRNDAYGGRLVEKPRDISRPLSRAERVKRDTLSEAASDDEAYELSDDTTIRVRGEKEFLAGIRHSVDDYKETVCNLEGLKNSLGGSSFEIMVDQIVAGFTVDTMSDLSKHLLGDDMIERNTGALKRALKSLVRRMGGSVSTKSIGVVMTQTALRTSLESRLTTSAASLLKLPFRAISRGSSILSVISLMGAALDILAALVYDPYGKYERYISDRLLRALAETELVMTQRLIGKQRLYLEPFEWMVNTRYLDAAKDATYDMLLGLIYTRARRVNSDGSIIYWHKNTGLVRNVDGELSYIAGRSDSSVFTDVDQNIEPGAAEEKTDTVSRWIIFLLFVLISAVFLLALVSNTADKRRTKLVLVIASTVFVVLIGGGKR